MLIWWCTPERRSPCSAATAWARPPPCARSPAQWASRPDISFRRKGDHTVGHYEINRLGISLVPEGRRLFPNLTLLENLRLAARSGGAALDEVFDLFPKLRLLQGSRAESLSGGERQMVAIARALMVPAKIVLLDEPFEGLAPGIVHEVMGALVKLRGSVSMIIVEHHAESVLPIVDRAYVLVNGSIAFEGSARALEADTALQARLLGVVQAELAAA